MVRALAATFLVLACIPRAAAQPADADHDRIPDTDDVCPAVVETPNGFEDMDGCADADGAAVRELAERIHFATGDASLDAAATAVVARLAAVLSAHAEITRAEIVGHADVRGDDAANQALSERRAESVRAALIAAGVDGARVVAHGEGALPGSSAAVQAENRRCDVRVVYASDPRDTASRSRMWRGSASTPPGPRNDRLFSSMSTR